MNCKCKRNGDTVLLSILPVATGTTAATSQEYYLELLHYFCYNRKICISSSYPLAGTLNYAIVGLPESVGNNTYSVAISITGTINFMPYVRNSGCCSPCPKQEYINIVVNVPVYSATGVPDVTLGATTQTALVSPANVEDCCNVTNACEIEATLVVNSTPPTTSPAA